MREILFRAKRLDNGEWVEGAYCPKRCSGDYPSIIKLGQPHEGRWFTIDPATVGQFTGLCDKNGKKIFEGDIVRAKEADEIIGYCEIKFGEYAGHIGFYADWYAGRMAKYFRNDLGYWATHKTIEVIGNRADNKKLLEADE